MIALYIIGGVFLLFFLILISFVSLSIEYVDDINIYAKFLFIKYTIYPEKEKRINLKDFTYKNYKKHIKDDKKKKPKKDTIKKESNSSISETINTVIFYIKKLAKDFFNHLIIEFCNIKIIVGSSDACKTAIEYGLVSQGLAYLLELLNNLSNLKTTSNIICEPDFVNQKSVINISIKFKIRIFFVVILGIKFAINYFKKKSIKTDIKKERD